MKRMAAALSAVMFSTGLCTLTAKAGEAEFMGRFFPSGQIPAPVYAPYLTYNDTFSDGSHIPGSINFFYDVPDELTNICDEIILEGDFAFQSKYRLMIENGISIQIDAKFDDGAWLSEQGDWDNFDYGSQMKSENDCFFLSSFFLTDDTTKMHYFTQSSLTYFDVTAENNAFLKPYIIKDEPTGSYLYDLENHTITYRYRYYIPYTSMESGSAETSAVFSEWSPQASIGKNVSLPALETPTVVETPAVTNFSTKFESETYCGISYYLTIPRSVYDGQKYFVATGTSYDPYTIETQVRLNEGEWVDVYHENAAWLNGGYRTTSYLSASPLAPDTLVEFRARIVCNALDGIASEWSEIVSNWKAPVETEITEQNIAQDATLIATDSSVPASQAENSCNICKACPVQPLGLCLVIWGIGGIAVIAGIVIILARRKKKKQK